MDPTSNIQQQFADLHIQPQRATMASQGISYPVIPPRRLSEDALGRYITYSEINPETDSPDGEIESHVECKRRRPSGVRTMVRRASNSFKSAFHHQNSKRSRKGSSGYDSNMMRYDMVGSSEESFMMPPSPAFPPEEAICLPRNLHHDTPRLARILGFNKDRRNAISGPMSNAAEGRSHSFSSPHQRSGLEPSGLSHVPPSGRAARASVSSPAHTERLYFHNFRFRKRDNRSVNSLPKDSESGVFFYSPDERDIGSAVPLIRKDPVTSLPPEVFGLVLSNLDAKSLGRAETVSRAWHEAASSRHVWRDVFMEKYKPAGHIVRTQGSIGGLGIGKVLPEQDWKKMYAIRKRIEWNWIVGNVRPAYLTGHTDSVYCVQFDEHKIITGSRDRTIRVWDIKTYKCLKVIGSPESRPQYSETQDALPVHSRAVPSPRSVNGTPEGNAIYHVPRDYHSASILSLQFDSEILVTGSSDSDCIVWDISTYEPRFRLRQHTMGVLDVCFDSNLIVTCSKDHTICVWARKTGDILQILHGHHGPVNAVQLRGNLLVSASGDGVAKLWNLTSGVCVKEFVSRDRGLAAVEFSSDAAYVLAGGNDNVIYKFSTASGELVHSYTGHQGLVRSLFLDAHNNRVVSGSYDQSIKVYNYQEGRLMAQYPNWTTSWILAAKCDYRRIVATSQDGRALILDFGLEVKGKDMLNG